MDCRETRTMLTAFHDGELSAADRARVEDHLRRCPECAALLADLARVDRAAGVPDPGPAYWNRFNARVMDRVEREADGPRVAVLRPKGGWMRQQLRYLAPAAAAAALIVMVVRLGGMHPATPTPAVPTAVTQPAATPSSEQRMAEMESESRAAKKAESSPVSRPVPLPVIANGRFATVIPEERHRLADRSLPSGNEEASRDRAAAPAAISASTPEPPTTFRGAPAGSPPVPMADEFPPGMQAERKKMAGEAVLMADRPIPGKSESASGVRRAKEASLASPCEVARTLADRERWREAETAQRACLVGDLPDPARETGLLFLAELLDRQVRFAEADAVIAEVDRRFPRSRPLDLYRQRRPMMWKRRE